MDEQRTHWVACLKTGHVSYRPMPWPAASSVLLVLKWGSFGFDFAVQLSKKLSSEAWRRGTRTLLSDCGGACARRRRVGRGGGGGCLLYTSPSPRDRG
eukprot:3719788-Rhodomonas_salina.1